MIQGKLSAIGTFDDYPSKSPEQVLEELWEEGLKNPMSEEEIDDFIKNVRRERRAVGS